ncbi:unnamed protein product [Vitrella brassicaformis CCMP3155]|uniref:3'-phosphate/5'-hydroxy nucleic acid ligase n=2 Tax=Vitrella brassicaformis TaxID=1169539 RepID=A0A0G4EDZ8_VITBC|nr:unnamed protein product [Vitrella brassicaformis CCMP3155]|eukprot:CEL93553.1 unnamed protein product [Vitrella brassicaformis CCMP3155]
MSSPFLSSQETKRSLIADSRSYHKHPAQAAVEQFIRCLHLPTTHPISAFPPPYCGLCHHRHYSSHNHQHRRRQPAHHGTSSIASERDRLLAAEDEPTTNFKTCNDDAVEDDGMEVEVEVEVAGREEGRAMVKRESAQERGGRQLGDGELELPIVVETRGVPVYIYTSDYDDATYRQLVALAEKPFVVGFVAAMPDVHLGKGATIGSVFATRDAICPNAVGVDIGCGMCAVPLRGLKRSHLTDGQLAKIQKGLKMSIPTGFDSHDREPAGAREATKSLMSEREPTSWIRDTFDRRHTLQLGTLGGGNHFIELVYDESDNVWMLLHSGSRNIGNITARHYDQLAAKQTGGTKEGLSFLYLDTKEGQDYLADMRFCQAYAFMNRSFMIKAFARVMQEVTRKVPDWSSTVNIHHNYCTCETCTYTDPHTGEKRTEDLYVTRKGATSAKAGELGIIPGSMGTGTYIVEGKGNSLSWQSCSHGAGRRMSRTAAVKHISQREFVQSMKGIVCDTNPKVRDEAPTAYKDLGEVMRNQASLVQVVHRLQPLVNVKGY